MVVGLTGGIGSGKTTVAKMFAQFDEVAVYIADTEAKQLMHSSTVIRSKLLEEFGNLAYENNQLNRKYIASIVFKNPEKLKKLNAIIHPEVRKHFFNFKENHQNKAYILYEAAILFESKASLLCDKIIMVYADETTRIKRVIQRDNTTEIKVKNRMDNQWSDAKKMMISNYLIFNNDLTNTRLQVHKIHNILTKKHC